MQCPACSKFMIEENFGGVVVDVCKNGCKGIWFDWMELLKLDEQSEEIGPALEEALNHPRTSDEGRGRIECPQCGIPMYTHSYKKAKEVNVDECTGCGGFFLDSGELAAIRDAFMTDDEHSKYVNSLISDVPEYAQTKQNIQNIKARTRAVRGLTSIFYRPHSRDGYRSWRRHFD